jgi:Large polyvalent protein-associated domain 3/HNH endonuclease
MSSPEIARAGGNEPTPWPRDYGHLQRLAARYAQSRLAGHAVVNRPSGRTIRFDWPQGLRSAVAPGTAPELLLAVPSLPALLAKAQPLGASDDPKRRHDVRRVHGFAASVDVAGQPITLWLIAREDKRGLLSFDGVVPRSPLVAPREDGGDLPDLPGARSRALRMVLARGAPVRRQDGGDTPDDADDQSETKPPGADPSPDAAPSDTAPPLQAPDPTPEPSEAPGATPSAPASASGTVDMNGLLTPEGRLDREAIFYRRKARLTELQAKNLDPKTDPEYRELLHLFARADRDRDEGALTFAFPEARVETEGAAAVERAEPWIERELTGLFSRGSETPTPQNQAGDGNGVPNADGGIQTPAPNKVSLPSGVLQQNASSNTPSASPAAAGTYTPKGFTPLDQLPPGSAGEPNAGERFGPSQRIDPGAACTYCGKPLVEERGPDQAQRDHVIPRSRGGNNDETNMTPACRTCNLEKGASTNEEWYARKRVREEKGDGR